MTGTVLITGCSSSFGEAAAKLLASRGWNVIATMRNPDGDRRLTEVKAAQVYAGMATNSDSHAVGKVVEAIFAAATDGTDQLRYMPNDDIRPILTARRESSEQDFIALMRGFFLPHLSTNA